MAFMDVITNPIVTRGLQGLASGMVGGADRRWMKKNRKAAEGYADDLGQGITEDDIMSLFPRMRQALMPLVKGIAGRSAAKYGSRSGATLGATMTGANQAMAPLVSQAFMERLRNNQANLRALYGGSMSAGSGSSSGLGI